MAEQTAYIVLRRDKTPEAENWQRVAEVKAANAESAIRLAVQKLNPADGSYVATPMRSWRPLTVTATTQTILKLDSGQAGE